MTAARSADGTRRDSNSPRDNFEVLARHASEHPDDQRIELRAGATLKLGGSRLVPGRGAIGARARHGVEGVCDRDDAGVEIYLVTAQAFGVAAPIPPLVMLCDDACDARVCGQVE